MVAPTEAAELGALYLHEDKKDEAENTSSESNGKAQALVSPAIWCLAERYR